LRKELKMSEKKTGVAALVGGRIGGRAHEPAAAKVSPGLANLREKIAEQAKKPDPGLDKLFAETEKKVAAAAADKAEVARKKAEKGRGNAPVAAPRKTKIQKTNEAIQKRVSAGKKAKAEAKAKAPKKISGLDAAVMILRGNQGKPMSPADIVEEAKAKGLWNPGGKTPAATLYSAIFREIKLQGKTARFQRVEGGEGRGLFELTASAK